MVGHIVIFSRRKKISLEGMLPNPRNYFVMIFFRIGQGGNERFLQLPDIHRTSYTLRSARTFFRCTRTLYLVDSLLQTPVVVRLLLIIIIRIFRWEFYPSVAVLLCDGSSILTFFWDPV